MSVVKLRVVKVGMFLKIIQVKEEKKIFNSKSYKQIIVGLSTLNKLMNDKFH